jgi:PhnB protein
VSNKNFAPEDYHSVTPYFTVDDADRFIEFLTAAFSASLIKQNRYDDNRIQHARLRIGSSIIMLNESTGDYPVNTSQMHLYVEDADATFELALRSGATAVMEPNDRPHGDRMAGIIDPCGNTWWIAAHRG